MSKKARVKQQVKNRRVAAAKKAAAIASRPILEAVEEASFSEVSFEPCDSCGNQDLAKFTIDRNPDLSFSMKCGCCGKTGPSTIHQNGDIAYLRWCRSIREARAVSTPA